MSSSAEHAPAPHVTPHVSADEQVRRQGIQPMASVDELAFPGVWESDEELDDFLADLLRLPPRQHAVSLIVLDTDVASASLRNRLPDRLRAALADHTMCITFVMVGELMKWRVLRSWG